MSFIYAMSTLTGADSTPLAVHSWVPSDATPRIGTLFYIHGLQSHAGWLVETGPALARRGIATYALDRHGSGRSGGAPGDMPSADVILDDCWKALAFVRQQGGPGPLTLLGQSFGGSILAAMAVEGLPEAERLIYCAPALGQQRNRHSISTLDAIRGTTGTGYSPVGLIDEDYSDKARYLEFMANDDLMLRQVTERARSTMVQIEDRYHDKRAGCQVPVHYVRPQRDSIIDLQVTEQTLSTLHGSFTTKVIPENNHFLEFTGSRRQYWEWLTELLSVPVLGEGQLISQ